MFCFVLFCFVLFVLQWILWDICLLVYVLFVCVCMLALFHVFMMMNMGLHREPGEQST